MKKRISNQLFSVLFFLMLCFIGCSSEVKKEEEINLTTMQTENIAKLIKEEKDPDILFFKLTQLFFPKKENDKGLKEFNLLVQELIISNICNTLKDETKEVSERVRAARVLGKFGKDALSAIPTLEKLSQHSNIEIATASKTSLLQIKEKIK